MVLGRAGLAAVAAAGFVATLAPGGNAAAQEGAPASVLEEITVTGSRIRAVSGMNAPVPVTVITAQEIDFSAPGSMVDALDKMPQFLNTSRPGTDQGIGTDANQSIVNMRGIGTNRTLILLDGRRVVPTTKQGTLDISILPDSMIERVEVVTGGASAAYGTDAVAGVTNFILDTDFEGYDAHLQAGQSTRGDVDNFEASFGYGTAIGERWHLITALDFSEADSLETWDDREWFQDWGVVTNPAFGQPGQPQLLTFPNVTSTLYSFGGMIQQPNSAALHRLVFQPDGTTTPYVLGNPFAIAGTQSQTGGSGGADIQRDRALFGVMPNVDRQNLFAHTTYDVSDDLQIYAQLIAGSNEVDGNGFPSVLHGPWQATIFRGNPYLPANVAQIMANENLASFGFSRMGSVADTTVSRLVQDNDFQSYTFGFEKAVNEWRIEGYVQTGRNEGVLDIKNFPRTDHLFAAMDAVENPANGQIVCNRTLFDPSFRCVPINLLGAGRASPEAIAYVTEGVKTATTVNRQEVVEVSADGNILDGWAGPVSLAAGIAYRKDTLNQVTVDPSNPTNDPSYVAVPVNNPAIGIRGIPLGFAGVNSGVQFSIVPNFTGEVTVKEAFSEIRVPLLADRSWAQQLTMTAAARWAEYTGSGGIWSWKTGFDWRVVDALRVRATVSRDVRAANMSERYDAAGAGATIMDPVFGNQNVTFTQIIGGNPNVEPEEADTRTVGFVIQPPGVEGLSISADWYSIEIAGSIGLLGPQRIVTDCYLGAQQLCEKVTRDPVTQVITGVSNVYLNINEEAVSGADLETVYSIDFDGSDRRLNLRLIGSWLNDHSLTNLGAPRQDRAGETGALSLPDFQAIVSATFNAGPLTVFLQERFIDEGMRRYNGNRPEIAGVTIDDNTVDSVLYTDLRVSYTFDRGSRGNFEVFGNVSNLFDEEPPLAANHSTFGGSTHTNVSLYDVIGRRVVVGAQFSF
jgi:iron complex outermembrane recepter protein